jgi:hypothetical protein
VNQDVDLQTAKGAGQIRVVSVKNHRLFGRQANRARGDSRPADIATADKDSQRRGRSKCGGDALTKETIPT